MTPKDAMADQESEGSRFSPPMAPKTPTKSCTTSCITNEERAPGLLMNAANLTGAASSAESPTRSSSSSNPRLSLTQGARLGS